MAAGNLAVDPVMQLATIGVLGVGAQWVAWRLRGVVLVAVAGLFGERLVALGIADGAMMAPLAFGLVAVTVVLHGFTLTPLARALGLWVGMHPVF